MCYAGDEGTTIIPFSRIVGSSTENGSCCVNWPDGKEYDAALVLTGKTFVTWHRAYVHKIHPSHYSTHLTLSITYTSFVIVALNFPLFAEPVTKVLLISYA